MLIKRAKFKKLGIQFGENIDNYSACRRRGGVLNSPHFCIFLYFFSVSEVGAALMGDTAGHKPREPT